MPQQRSTKIRGMVALFTLFTACAQRVWGGASPPPARGAAATVPASPPGRPLVTGLPDFSGLVAAVGPAVVNVSVIEKAGGGGRSFGNGSPFGNGNDDDMDEFFRRFFGTPPRGGTPRDNTPRDNVPRQRGE